MKYTREQIKAILQSGENEQVEFKVIIRDPLLLSKLISAFANQNGGKIIVGVGEPIKIIGCDYNQLIQLLERAKSNLKPIPKIEITKIVFDGKIIGIIDVEKSNNIILASGGVFVRQGERVIPMPSDKLMDKISQFAASGNLELLAEAIYKQTETIEKLQDEIQKLNSIKSKLKDYFIGGIIGAIIGLILTLLFAG